MLYFTVKHRDTEGFMILLILMFSNISQKICFIFSAINRI